MSPLTRYQRTLLRAWAVNLTIRFPLTPRSYAAFSYTSEESARLEAIAADVPEGAFATWLCFLLLIAAAMIGAMALLLSKRVLQFLPTSVLSGIVVLFVFASIAVAACLASLLADARFQAKPFQEVEGDAALFAKLKRQFAFVAAIVLIVGALTMLVEK